MKTDYMNRGDTLYTFEVVLAPPMFNFAIPMFICNPNIFPLDGYSDESIILIQTELRTEGVSWESWEKLGLYWELLVLGKIKGLGPGSGDSAPTPGRIRVDYSTKL